MGVSAKDLKAEGKVIFTPTLYIVLPFICI